MSTSPAAPPANASGHWLAPALATVALFGLWQLLPRLPALRDTPPLGLQAAALPGLLLVLAATRPWRTRPDRAPANQAARARARAWAVATGAAGALGTLAILRAFAAGGPASLVTPLCGMYPIVTALLSRVLLRERLSRAQQLGLCLFALATAAFGEAAGLDADARGWGWLPPVVFAMVLFGASGLSMKLATRAASDREALAGWIGGFVVMTGVLLLALRPELPDTRAGWALAVGYGLLLGAGLWTSFAAYARGPAGAVTALTALYPAVTATLAAALPAVGEQVGPRQVLAIALALAAGAALAIEGPAARPP